jgi:hypothetical protein
MNMSFILFIGLMIYLLKEEEKLSYLEQCTAP